MTTYDDIDGPNFRQGDCPVCKAPTAWDWREREFFCLQCNWKGQQTDISHEKANP